MQLLIHRASVWALRKDEQKFKLGGLMAIISHSDRQLLGNNLSFTLCSIHILFNSNKFNKFWMSFDFRWTHAKNGQNWAESKADRPLLGRTAWHLYTRCHIFDPGAMWHVQMPLSQELDVGMIEWTEGLHKDQRTHTSVQTRVQVTNPPPRKITILQV